MAETIFGKIARGEIKADIVASSERCIAFRDIAPQAPVHVLVIPKDEYATLDDVQDASLLGELLMLAKRVAEQEGLGKAGYRVVINTGADGGQTVFHLHAHVMGGRHFGWPPG